MCTMMEPKFAFFEWLYALHWSFYAIRCMEFPDKKAEVNLVTLLQSNFFISGEEVNIRIEFHLQSMLILSAYICIYVPYYIPGTVLCPEGCLRLCSPETNLEVRI